MRILVVSTYPPRHCGIGAYASAQVDYSSTQKLNVGGNLFSIGIMFHFLQPDDKGHPQAPR